jgi:glycosyltransferase involved in cell wall biosynthesis
MTAPSPLVSVGLPIRNAEQTVEGVVASVLAQTHDHLELIISDNASSDGTESVCRALAATDSRVIYHRQSDDIGLLANFRFVLSESRGEFFRWIGDDDTLHADYAATCIAMLRQNPDAVLTTTQISYTDPDGVTETDCSYDGIAMSSADPVDRLDAMLRYLNESYLLVDPLYAMMRRARMLGIVRRNMLREDQLYSAKLALAGPWAHVPELLANRHIRRTRLPALARRLEVPAWQVRVTNSLLCVEMLREIDRAPLSKRDRHRARASVARFYRRRQALVLRRRVRRLGTMITPGRRPG